MTSLGSGFDRRAFVGGAGAAGIYLFGTPALTSAAVRRIGVASDVKFASGVASGQIAQRAATIWTQVDGLGANAKLNYQVATDMGFTNVIRNGKVAVDAASGTARLRLTNKKADGTLVSKAKRLKPGERYYYRFFNSNDTAQSIVGRFRTALPPDSNEKLKIAFFACQDYGTGFYTAHRDMAKQDVDMVVALGDYMYENSFFVGAIRDLPKTPDGQVRTLDEYRNQYRTYNSDADLQAVRAMAPMTVIWDDHEVEDNYAGDLPGGYFADPAADGTPARTFESTGDPQFSFDQRRKNAYKAFFEVHPVIRNPAEADRTYGSIRNGQVELFALDTRQYRTDQPCNPDDAFLGFCSEQSQTTDPNATLLGPAQRNWLVNGLKTSKARWKLVANQVMMMALDIFPGNTMNTDAWDGYAAERAYICDVIAQNNIKNVSFFTGDIHTYFAGHVTRTGREPWVPFAGMNGGAPVASELVVGSISSQGISDRISTILMDIGYGIEKQFNPNAIRQSDEALRNGIAEIVDPLALGLNPHMNFANTSYKGYGLAEVGKDSMKVKFRATRDTRFENSQAFTLASFTVKNGDPNVYRDATASARRLSLPVQKNVPLTKDEAMKYMAEFAAHH